MLSREQELRLLARTGGISVQDIVQEKKNADQLRKQHLKEKKKQGGLDLAELPSSSRPKSASSTPSGRSRSSVSARGGRVNDLASTAPAVLGRQQMARPSDLGLRPSTVPTSSDKRLTNMRPHSAQQSAAQRKVRTYRREEVLEPIEVFEDKLNSAVETKQDLDAVEEPFFRTALWEATWKNNGEVVRLLADKRACVSKADYQGRTPLHEAAYYGHLNLAEFLIERGHPIDCGDSAGETPLFRAVHAGRHEMAQTLIQLRAQVDLLDAHSVTVRHIAAFNGHGDLANWLLYKGAITDYTPVISRSLAIHEKQKKALSVRPAASAHPQGHEKPEGPGDSSTGDAKGKQAKPPSPKGARNAYLGSRRKKSNPKLKKAL